MIRLAAVVAVVAALLGAPPAGAAEEPVVGAGFASAQIAVDHDGDRVLFTSGARNIDPLVDARTPEGTYLWTPTGLGRLVPEGSLGIDITPDGETAVVLSHGRVATLSVDAFDGLHVIAEDVCCSPPSISADGRLVAWTDTFDGVYLHDRVDGSTVEVEDVQEPSHAVLSDDGTTLAYKVYAEGIVVRDLGTGERTVLETEGGEPQLSADGRIVVYTTFEDDRSAIVLHDRTTGTERRIADAFMPSLSADGTRLAYAGSDGQTLPQVHLRDLDTGESTLVSRTPAGRPGNSGAVHPRISGDGRTIVFESSASDLVAGMVKAPSTDLFAADVETGAIELLTVARDAGLHHLRTDGFVNSYGAAQPRTPQPRLDGAVAIAEPAFHHGFWVASASGRVARAGFARHHGELTTPLARPIVDLAGSASGNGYWLVASDGGVFSFGDAAFHGSTGALRLNQPIVGMAPTPSAAGYWLVASDGGIFSFGDARFHGSTGAIRLNQPIVGMARTPTGRGYWLVARDGGIFAFGDARFHGSTGAIALNQPIVAMVRTHTGSGYRLIAADGGVFAFGDAGHIWGPSDPRCDAVCIVDASSA